MPGRASSTKQDAAPTSRERRRLSNRQTDKRRCSGAERNECAGAFPRLLATVTHAHDTPAPAKAETHHGATGLRPRHEIQYRTEITKTTARAPRAPGAQSCETHQPHVRLAPERHRLTHAIRIVTRIDISVVSDVTSIVTSKHRTEAPPAPRRHEKRETTRRTAPPPAGGRAAGRLHDTLSQRFARREGGPGPKVGAWDPLAAPEGAAGPPEREATPQGSIPCGAR